VGLQNIALDRSENPGIDLVEDSCFSAQNSHPKVAECDSTGMRMLKPQGQAGLVLRL
jgi:hypothetical protein